ncbi:MAG: putative methyltransferase [Halieaceae bacterium]|jgi:predicted methyltransferase
MPFKHPIEVVANMKNSISSIMYCSIVVLFAALTLGACAPNTTQQSANAIAAALSSPGRSDADLARDKRSRPEVVLDLLRVKPGDTVLDFFGGGGYYSDILGRVVGSKGKVLLHNNKAYMGFVGDSHQKRFGDNPAPQVEIYMREIDDLGLSDNSLDGAMIIMSFHDFYYTGENWPEIDTRKLLGQIRDALKPGARFVIVDHAAVEGTGSSAAQELHRIEEAFARRDIVSNGFKFAEVSWALGNPLDDRTRIVFDPAIQGKSDRFILVFEKP